MGRILEKIAMALNLLALLGAVGVFVYTTTIYKRPIPDNNEEYKELEETTTKQATVGTVKLEKVIINLPSQTRLRFLDIQIHLLPISDKDLNILNHNDTKTMVYDVIIDVASKMAPEELNSVTGKILLEERIKKTVHERLDQPLIKKILFTRYVVQ